MEKSINPENWKDIFSDHIYIVSEAKAQIAPIDAARLVTPIETAKVTVTIKDNVIPITTPSIPKTPSIPATPSLTAIKEQVVALTPEAVAPTLKPIGKYNNGILILMHTSYTMTPQQQEMLGKIVKAAQLDYNDCGILQVTTPVSFKEIENLKARIILSFGLPKDAFIPPLTKELYTIQKYNSTIVLLADSLAKLETTVALKGSLWNAMKEMFGIK